jgi:hypothetical protein
MMEQMHKWGKIDAERMGSFSQQESIVFFVCVQQK